MKSLGYEMLKSCYCTTLLCAVLCRATTYHWLTCQWNNQCLEFHSRWLWIYSSHSLYMKDEDHVSAGNSLWWFCHGLTCYTSERRITTLCHASRMSLSLVIVIVVIVIIWYLISVMCCCVENAILNKWSWTQHRWNVCFHHKSASGLMWPWRLISDLLYLFTIACSHGEYLCQDSVKSLQ